MFGWKTIVLSIVVAAPAIGGCNRQEEPAKTVPSAKGVTPEQAVLAEGYKLDVTDAEARSFGERLVAVLNERRTDELPQYFDFELIAKVGVRGVTDRSVVENYLRSCRKFADATSGGVTQALLQEECDYHLLRVTNDASGKRLQIRALGRDRGISYFSAPLARSPAGAIVAFDLYGYVTGENYSDMLRRRFIYIGREGAPTILLAYAPSDPERYAKTVAAMIRSLSEERFAAVIDAYRKLPEDVQRDRLCLAVYVDASARISPEAYRDALDDVRTFHGDADWAAYVLFDHDFHRGDYRSALTRLTRLEKQLGGDPYLEVSRANVYSHLEDRRAALAAARRAVAGAPEIRQVHEALIDAALAVSRFDLVKQSLLVLEKRFQIDVDRRVLAPSFAGFRSSPEFAKWKSERA
jgi:tetratricopeptide (TPR) repeat protein